MIGSQLDKYEVLQKIGEGGMATVYKGRHQTLGRDVAIKVLHPHLSASTRNRKRFAREARAIEHLDHDNILKIFDYSGVDVEDCYIVTEFVDGWTLQELLSRQGIMPSEVAAIIGLELLAALHYAHASGIIHRDLKLENVMLRRDGTVKLMDFGIARFLDESTVTIAGSLVGSPAYMSPEQALEKAVDARSDLFSMGTLLYHLVTGQLPFSGSNPSLILRNIIEGTRAEVLEVQPGVSPRLADIIERLLQADPANRYGTAQDVLETLEGVLVEASIHLEEPRWALSRYLEDPEAYEQRLTAHLDEVLLVRAKEAFAQGDPLAAQRLLNRLLVHDANHPEVLELLSSLHQQSDERERSLTISVLVGAVLLLLLSALAWFGLRPEPPDPIAPPSTPTAELGLSIEPPLKAQAESPTPLGVSMTDPSPNEAGGPPSLVVPMEPSQKTAIARPQGRAIAPLPTVSAPPSEPIVLTPEDAEGSAKVTVKLTEVGWADVFLDGERVGQVRQPLTLELAPGGHTLTLTNAWAKDYSTRFEIAADEERVFEVPLIKKPVKVTFLDTLDGRCTVRVDTRLMGSVDDLGRGFDLQDPDRRHTVELQCPDGETRAYPVAPQRPGSQVLIPPPRPMTRGLTPMSRLWARQRRPLANDPLRRLFLGAWPAACMTLGLSGCYFGPIEVIDSNLPPVIIDSNYLAGETILLERSSQKIFIVVEDESPEILRYTWTLSEDGFIGDAQTFPDGGSQVTLGNEDLGLEGQTLRVRVRDDIGEDSRTWPLEVLQ